MLALSVSVTRWLALCSSIFLSGTLALIWLTRDCTQAWCARWRERCFVAVLLLCAAALLTAICAALLQAVQVAGVWRGQELTKFFFDTHGGHVWIARWALLLLIFALIGARGRLLRVCGFTAFVALAALFATSALAVAAFGGHALAFDPAWPTIAAQATHLTAVGWWLGALPALALLLRESGAAGVQAGATRVLQRFSEWALWLMAAIIASGVPLADLQVERVPALIGTPYGMTLLWKLLAVGAVLGIAAHLRFALLPRLGASAHVRAPNIAARWIALECAFAVIAVWLATKLGTSVPARHDAIVWPFSFRYSLDATWPDAKVRERVSLGLVVVALSATSAWIAWRQHLAWRRWVPLALLLLLVGLATALPPLQTDAYPDTYRKTSVPYQAISVANGRNLFRRHCVACHGVAGHGDGVLAASLARRPADLTEPHTALHTAGDLFWWLTHGKPPGVMPGFAAALNEDERWDLINFLRALSAGYQARIIDERIAPRKPWLAAPDFSFTTAARADGTLKDFRGERPVLLMFGEWPILRARLAQLTQARMQERMAILAVPSGAVPETPRRDEAAQVVVEGNEEIVATYYLLRRTLGNAAAREEPLAQPHVEFVIDRFGYVRARWVAAENAQGWQDVAALRAQVLRLDDEPQILPPPDDHVH